MHVNSIKRQSTCAYKYY